MVDVTIRQSTADKAVKAWFTAAGHSASMGERERTTNDGTRKEFGPDAAKQTSYELGGRPGLQTVATLQNMVKSGRQAGEEN